MPRFLHTADWQIGRQFATFDPEHAVILAEARTTAVERLAALANEHQVQAVLVAGDVFDTQTVSDRVIRRLFQAMAGFAGPWLMIPGNHDAALTESVWTRAQRLGAVPPNAHLLLTPEVRVFADLGFAVLPAPLTQRHTHGDLTEWFDRAPTPDGLLRIGLGHGSVQGILAEGIDSANPIAPDRPERARLDYLALGDWHGAKAIGPRLWYSGTPEPDRFRNNDAGLALLVNIDAPGAEPVVQPLPVAQFTWHSVAAQLSVPTDVDAVVAQLAAFGRTDVVDLHLQGHTDWPGHQRLQAAIGQADAQTRHLQADLGELRMLPTDDDMAALKADGYLGEVLAELRQTLAQPASADDARLAEDALALLATHLAD